MNDIAATPLNELAAADPAEAWSERLATVEAFTAQLGQAVEQVVDAVVALQQTPAPAADLAPSGAEAALKAITALNDRLMDLERQVDLERTCRDLERVSRLHPKTRSAVFVATTYFGCNVKYAWLAFRAQAQAEGIDCWLLPQSAEQMAMAASLGAPCFPASPAEWTTEHMTAALSAAVVVTCDHFLSPNPYAPALLAGARHVQLWHGVSIKEIGLRNLAPLKHMSARFARVLATTGPYSRLIGTAADAEGEWRRWFGFDRYEPIGYPRNDVLFREPTEADLLNVDRATLDAARAARAAGQRVVLYAPTFRDAKRGVWVIEAGLQRLARDLAQRGDLLLVNLHPVEQPMIAKLAEAAPAARFVAMRTEIYPLLREVDVLVTDYSSVMFDYLLLDRPIVLFRPDHADYVARSRTLFDDKLKAHPGPLVDTAAALLNTLRSPNLDAPEHRERRHALRDRLHDHVDGGSGERLNAVLVEEIALGVQASTPSRRGFGWACPGDAA